MSKSKVYHRDPLSNPFGEERIGFRLPTESSFQLVAEVDSLDLNKVFELTNHIDHDWTENSEVNLISNRTPRSTSVGDVIVVEDKHFLVEPVGWKEVPESILG